MLCPYIPSLPCHPNSEKKTSSFFSHVTTKLMKETFGGEASERVSFLSTLLHSLYTHPTPCGFVHLETAQWRVWTWTRCLKLVRVICVFVMFVGLRDIARCGERRQHLTGCKRKRNIPIQCKEEEKTHRNDIRLFSRKFPIFIDTEILLYIFYLV